MPAHRKFEYRVQAVDADVTVKDMLVGMNELGQEGWEIYEHEARVATEPVGGSLKHYTWLYARREIVEA